MHPSQLAKKLSVGESITWKPQVSHENKNMPTMAHIGQPRIQAAPGRLSEKMIAEDFNGRFSGHYPMEDRPATKGTMDWWLVNANPQGQNATMQDVADPLNNNHTVNLARARQAERKMLEGQQRVNLQAQQQLQQPAPGS